MRRVYRGACHCGRTRFEVTAAIDHARVCDCSICRRRGTLNFRVEEAEFRLLTPLEDLTLYQWGRRTARDYFCPVCGVLPFRRPGHPTPAERAQGVEIFTGWAVNLRCLDGLDPDALPRRLIRGSLL